MKNDQVYEIRLTATGSISTEVTQTKFMSEVFELANKSGLQGHGLEITRRNADDDTGENKFRKWMIDRIVSEGLDDEDIFHDYLESDELWDSLVGQINELNGDDMKDMVDEIEASFDGNCWLLYQYFYGTQLIEDGFCHYLVGCGVDELIRIFEEEVL